MTLRARTLVSIGLAMIILLATLYTISHAIVLGSFTALEEQQAHDNLQKIANFVQEDVDALSIFTFDWATWDDTYAFVEDLNETFIKTNLTETTFSGSRLNFILFVNKDGELVYSRGFNLHEGIDIPVPQSLIQQATGDTPLATHPDPDSVIQGLIMLPEGLLVVASRPILNSEGEGPIHGALIMARYMDDEEIELLGEKALLPLTLQTFDAAPAELRADLTAEDPYLVRPVDEDTIAGYILLNDIYGQPAAILQADIAREVYQYGQRSLSYFMVALLATGAVFSVVMIWLLERSVLARVTRLSADVGQIGANGDLSRRVRVKGKDELSGLADSINQTLAALEQAQAEHARADEALRQHSYTLAQLDRLSQQLTATFDRDQIAGHLSRIATEIIGTEGISVWLLDPDKQDELFCWFSYNQPRLEEKLSLVNLRLRIDQGVVGWVMQHRENVIVSDAAADPRFFAEVDAQIDFQTRSLLAVPLQVRGSVIGVLELVNKIKGRFTDDDLSLVETLAASVAIAVDNARLVEELRQYTAELEAQNAELDAFAHTVAHDLKKPLSTLVALSSFLEAKHDQLTSAEVQDSLQALTQSGCKAANIVDALLLLASVRKVEEVKAAPVDMGAVVAEACRRLSDMIAEFRAEVIAPDAWPTAIGYSPWIEEVWVNYVSNAIKYGGSPPRVVLGAEAQADGMVRFWVRDSGQGLTAEEQEHLFTQFTRLHQVRIEGYGLGLSIVRRIVEKLGGEVGVKSTAGQGSTFYFTLPAG